MPLRPVEGVIDVSKVASDGGLCFAMIFNQHLTIVGPDATVLAQQMPLVSELDFNVAAFDIAPFSGGTHVLATYSEAPYLQVLRTEVRTEDLLERARTTPWPCLDAEARAVFGLDPSPPEWCITESRL